MAAPSYEVEEIALWLPNPGELATSGPEFLKIPVKILSKNFACGKIRSQSPLGYIRNSSITWPGALT